MDEKIRSYHVIAIGGAVMHNMALELQAHGHNVTGSDDEIFDPAKSRLQAAGLLPQDFGWFPEKVHQNLDAVILGMHARSDNPELIKAQQLGLPIYSFPEFVYRHAENKKRIVIGGSHGKTTSTAMLMHVLKTCGLEFDYLVGSQLPGFERMVKLSDAPLMVIEGDEYLTSALHPVPKFHVYKPHLAMLTGVAWDHVNVFPTFENYVSQFEIFLKTLQPGARWFWYEGDPDLENLARQSELSNQSYREPTFTSNANGCQIHVEGRDYQLNIFGRHNLQNAAGVALLAAELGIDSHRFWTSMQSFAGTAKRLEKVYESEQVVVYRDFAHAPSKVKATVQAVREQFPNDNLIAVFELHTYSSLQPNFLPGYRGTLSPADHALVLYDPHVFELKRMPVPDDGFITSQIGDCLEFSNPHALKDFVLEAWDESRKNVLLLMSSGNLGGLKPEDFLRA
ncbi:MAG: UDP-N-acetylmuramate--L-alanine ligase [Sphingomonadales bacterium]|jgi:UDP-N-acetylmuramate: L-alanyl-gamma-D-glutamyl-meso-diaminopimelate ligase